MTAAGAAMRSELPAKCHLRDRHREAVTWRLTEAGCLIDLGQEFLRSDDIVILVFAGHLRVFAKVLHAGVRDSQLAFDPPMHPAVLSHLLASPPHDAEPRTGSPKPGGPDGAALRPV